MRRPWQWEDFVRPCRPQQRGRQPQRVRGDDIVIGQPVHEQQRPAQGRRIPDQRAAVVGVLGCSSGWPRWRSRQCVSYSRWSVTGAPAMAAWKTSGAPEHRQRREEPAVGPAADRDPAEVQRGLPPGRLVQRRDLVSQRRPGHIQVDGPAPRPGRGQACPRRPRPGPHSPARRTTARRARRMTDRPSPCASPARRTGPSVPAAGRPRAGTRTAGTAPRAARPGRGRAFSLRRSRTGRCA